MAKKMKNGLFRVQCYLTESAFEIFNKERESHNHVEETSKLSESGFCHLKLTGSIPSLRGAPKGNKNAAGQRAKKRISDVGNALVLNPENIDRARREETPTGENFSTLIPELPNEKSSFQDVNVAAENELPDVLSELENQDKLSANSPTYSVWNDCDYDANGIPVSCEKFLSKNDESNDGKIMWTEDDFDEVFDNLNALDRQIKAENYQADEDADFGLKKDSESKPMTDSRPPKLDQPSLF